MTIIDWESAPWPLPQFGGDDEYQRDAINGAADDEPGYAVDAAGDFNDDPEH